jgi:hypothetical protein
VRSCVLFLPGVDPSPLLFALHPSILTAMLFQAIF